MGSFGAPWWNHLIVILTLLGLLGLVWLIAVNSTKPTRGEETTGHVWDGDLEELNNPLPRWWVNLFIITLIFGGVYLALYPGLGLNRMLLGWTQVAQYEAEVAAADARYGPQFDRFLAADLISLSHDKKAIATGRRLFLNYCATCHGSDGRGSRGFPNLADRDWLYGGDPQKVKASIMQGRNGVMPPWETVLGGKGQVDEMAHYVRSLSGLAHEGGPAAAAAPKFGQFCAACHGADGAGNPSFGAPNLRDDVWLYGGTHAAIADVIAQGRIGRMPPHEQFLGEAKSHVLTAYVLWLSREGQE